MKGEAGTTSDIVELRDHDPSWPAMFQKERDLVISCLEGVAVSVDHIGSTAVPGLRAKPIIDLLVSVPNLELDQVIEPLTSIGYVHMPIPDVGRLFFRKGMPRTHHLHVVVDGGPEHWKHIRFRDRLISHPEDLREYARLKEELALKYRNDRTAYSDGKDALIEDILARDDRERAAAEGHRS